MDINDIFERLFNFFNVSTITELAKKLEMSQPAITNWERRNSVSAIKKRCRVLGIYNEIFGDLNINNNQINESKIENFSINIVSYNNINMKKIIRDWGIQGYGITVGIILYLKENDTLNLTDIDLLADDLKTSTFLIKKVIEDCNFFLKENNIITLRTTL